MPIPRNQRSPEGGLPDRGKPTPPLARHPSREGIKKLPSWEGWPEGPGWVPFRITRWRAGLIQRFDRSRRHGFASYATVDMTLPRLRFLFQAKTSPHVRANGGQAAVNNERLAGDEG